MIFEGPFQQKTFHMILIHKNSVGFVSAYAIVGQEVAVSSLTAFS